MMTRLDDTDLDELQTTLSNLASNPRIPATYRDRLRNLQSAVGVRRVTRRDHRLPESDIDRFQYLIARLQIAVQAQKQDLELQVKQYDEREKRLKRLLDGIEAHRKERDSSKPRRGRRSPTRRDHPEEDQSPE